MRKYVVLLLSLLATITHAVEPTIAVTSAAQRYPWNGMVDFTFTITGESGVKYTPSFAAKDLIGGTNLVMKTFHRVVDGTIASPMDGFEAGTYSLVWDAASDLPKGFRCDRVRVEGSVGNLYMVIDLSDGANAIQWPILYLDAIPDGGWTDEYKTTKLALRRIPAGMDPLGRYTLTQDFFVGVFEVTQKQWQLIMGGFSSGGFRFDTDDVRLPYIVSHDAIRGKSVGTQWPMSSEVDVTSFIGVLRGKTGVDFDLPTEAQWEYACRAGTVSAYNNGGGTEADLKELGRYSGNENDGRDDSHVHTTIVGSYAPNQWGLHDMHGNVWEWCLDRFDQHGSNTQTEILSGKNPRGPESGDWRVLRGGSAWNSAIECTSSKQGRNDPFYSNQNLSKDLDSPGYFGFRLCCTMTF